MDVWFAMLKKELRLQRGVAIGILIALVLFGLLALWLAFSKDGLVSGVILMFPLFLHIFFLPIYMLSSVQKEWKHTASTFLQMPISGWKLLSAKLVSGLIYFFASFTLTFILCMISIRLGVDGHLAQRIHWSDQDAGPNPVKLLEQFWGFAGRTYVLVLCGMLYANLVFSPITTLFAVLVQWLRSTIRKAAGFLTFLACAAFIWLLTVISDTTFYASISKWGEFSIPFDSMKIGHLYTGEILFDLLLTVGLFLGAGWLIDRKVEV